MAFVIRSAGARESMLNNAGERVGEYEYASRDAALAALRLGDEAVTEESSEGGAWYAYRNQEDADRDETGAAAEAVIVEQPSTYTYTIYDADPNVSGPSAWGSPHEDAEIKADSDEEAIDDVRDILESAARGLSTHDGYAVGQRIYANVWDADGINVKTVSYELTESDLA